MGERVEVELRGRFPARELRFTLAADAGGGGVCLLPTGELGRLPEGDPALLDRVLALFR